MGLSFYRKRHITKSAWLNFSGSGASASKKTGRVTVNTRGRVNVRLPGGFRWRGKL